MNGKQAARMNELRKQTEQQQARIDELTYITIMQAADIKDYVSTVHAVASGGCPCDWCEEKRLGECEHPDQYDKTGCDGWWLRLRPDHPLAMAQEEEKREQDAQQQVQSEL